MGRWMFGIFFACVLLTIVFAKVSSNLEIERDLIKQSGFRLISVQKDNIGEFRQYSTSQPYPQVQALAMGKLKNRGYVVTEKNGVIVFHRGGQVRVMIVKGVRYKPDGNLTDDPKSTSMWTTAPDNFVQRIIQTLDL